MMATVYHGGCALVRGCLAGIIPVAAAVVCAFPVEAGAETVSEGPLRPKSVLEECVRLYRGLDVYLDRYDIHLVAEWELAGEVKTEELARENGVCLAASGGRLSLVAGRLLTTVNGTEGSWREWLPETEHVVQREFRVAPEPVLMDFIPPNQPFPLYPIARLGLSNEWRTWQVFPEIRSLRSAVREARSGVAGVRVIGTLNYGPTSDGLLEFWFWRDDALGFVREIGVDLTPVLRGSALASLTERKVPGGAKVARASLVAAIEPEADPASPGPKEQFASAKGTIRDTLPFIGRAEETSSLRRWFLKRAGLFQPQTSRSGGMDLEDYVPERLISLGKGTRFSEGSGNPLGEVDLDGDKHPEMLYGIDGGSIVVLDGEATIVRTLWLKLSEPVTRITEAKVFRRNGQWYWLVTYQMHSQASSSPRLATALINDGGRPLWVFEPWLPRGLFASIRADHGDLTGDGIPEYVVGVTSLVEPEEGVPAPNPPPAVAGTLVVLSDTGRKICGKQVGKDITMVRAIPGPAGEAGNIVCISDNELLRFKFTERAPIPLAEPASNH